MPPTRAAFGIDSLRGEGRHFDIVGVFRHVDELLVSARIIKTGRDQPLHTKAAHVAERHRLAGELAAWKSANETAGCCA